VGKRQECIYKNNTQFMTRIARKEQSVHGPGERAASVLAETVFAHGCACLLFDDDDDNDDWLVMYVQYVQYAR